MATTKTPFRATNMKTLFNKVLSGVYPKIPPTYSGELASVIKGLLNLNPALRPSCEQILKMGTVRSRIVSLAPV